MSHLEKLRAGLQSGPSIPGSLQLRTQDLAEVSQEDLDARIVQTWRHIGVMLHLRSTHESPPRLELPGQWRPCLVGTLGEQQERPQRYKRKYYKVRNMHPGDEFGSATSSSDSQESEGAKMRRKQRNKHKRVRRRAREEEARQRLEAERNALLARVQAMEVEARPPSLGMFFVLCCCWVTKIPNGYTRGNTFQSLGNNNSG